MTAISVAMATHNGVRFLQEQLNSLAAQTRLPDELVVTDDASSDETVAMLRRFAETAPIPVRIHLNPSPLGYGENFIRTALQCRGDWIAFCDQDDVWEVGKLQRCGEELRDGPSDLGLIVHGLELVDEQLRPLTRTANAGSREVLPARTLDPEWFCLGLSMVFKAALIREIPSDERPSFPWHKHHAAHDVWVCLLANMTGSIVRFGEPLVQYRRHGAAVTDTDAGGRLRKLQALARSAGDEYGARAAYLMDVWGLLHRCAAMAPAWSAPLHEGARAIAMQAEFLRTRSQVYRGSGLAERLGSLRRLVGQGGYQGQMAWPFGWRRFCKDAIYALQPL